MVPANRSTRRCPPVRRRSRLWASVLLPVACCTVWWGCEEADPPGPFELVEMETWKATNKSHLGRDGIFVQATLRTFAYEISQLYAAAEESGLDQSQFESRLREFVHLFIDGSYRVEDGTDINNLYLQYLVYVDRDFDPTNPLEKGKFDVWRAQYIRQLMSKIYDFKYPLLRHTYDERWGVTLFSRLVFQVYIDNTESELRPRISDIGDHIFLVDEEGVRYRPSGLDGPYPYSFDRPQREFLDGKEIVRLFFPNRQADRRTPIVTEESKYVELLIEGFGGEQIRRLRWDLPITYPQPPRKRLPPAGENRGSRKGQGETYRKLQTDAVGSG